MAESFLTHTNRVIARLNEVQLTSSNFTSSRGIQTQCKNAVNDAINYVFQREFGWGFSHAEQTKTLVAGTTRYAFDEKGITMLTIAKANGINIDTPIKPGQKLKLR